MASLLFIVVVSLICVSGGNELIAMAAANATEVVGGLISNSSNMSSANSSFA